MTGAVAKGSAAGDLLRAFIARIEAIESEQQELSDDKKAVYAEAKASGLDTKAIRAIVKLRKQDSAEQSEFEQIVDLYKNALGMTLERPLFERVGLMRVDLAAREEVVEAFKELAPVNGEVIVRMGGAGIRLWRTSEGKLQVEDVVERPDRDRGGDVLPLPPKKKKLSIIELAAERAERLSKMKVVDGKVVPKDGAKPGDPPAEGEAVPDPAPQS